MFVSKKIFLKGTERIQDSRFSHYYGSIKKKQKNNEDIFLYVKLFPNFKEKLIN